MEDPEFPSLETCKGAEPGPTLIACLQAMLTALSTAVLAPQGPGP